MGNHHRRSKGCETCRSKKVKCDERRPTCFRCERIGFPCGGYSRTTFINSMDQVMKRFDRKNDGASWSSFSKPPNTKEAIYPTSVNRGTKTTTFYKNQIADSYVEKHYRLLTNPLASAFLDEPFVIYAMENLTAGPLRTVYGNALPFRLKHPSPQKTMMNYCILALAKIYCGRGTHDSSVIQSGLRVYGGALRMLNAVLHKTNGCVTTEILVSVFVLSLCEVRDPYSKKLTFNVLQGILPSNKASWMTHISGLERLFAARGPMTMENSSMLELALLDFCRPVMVFGAFFTHKPSLMSRREWHPSISSLSSLPAISYLVGHLARLPVLFIELARCLQLSSKTYPLDESRSKLWTEIALLRSSLRAWKEFWDNACLSRVREVAPAIKGDLSPITPWTTVLEFDTAEVANSFVLYNVVLIFLTNIPLALVVDGLHPPPQILAQSDGVVLNETDSISVIKLSAINICRSLEHQQRLLHISHNQRDLSIFFPVHVVRRVLFHLGSSSELEWMDKTFETMLAQTSLGIWAEMNISDEFIGFRAEMFHKNRLPPTSRSVSTISLPIDPDAQPIKANRKPSQGLVATV